jgi:hypothetical protein
MTSAEIVTALTQVRPNGVSFEPLAVRLLRQQIPFLGDCAIEELKRLMFQLGSRHWFAKAMIADDDTLFDIKNQARKWLKVYGFFSVERLLQKFGPTMRHIATQEDCSVFLQHLQFMTTVWRKSGHFFVLPHGNLDEALKAAANTLTAHLDDANGLLIFDGIAQTMPHLSAVNLEAIRAHFLPHIHAGEVGGMYCWRNAESLALPEDFSEKLTAIVDTLYTLNEKISASNLSFALNLFYRVHFREEFGLQDNDALMRVCVEYYQGENSIFYQSTANRTRIQKSGVSPKRIRRANTTFGNLDIPIGTKLIFTKDNDIVCHVLDDINQVEYEGRAWAISALTNHLLGVNYTNGFYLFSHEGENLFARRMRLNREKQSPQTPPEGTASSDALEEDGILSEVGVDV